MRRGVSWAERVEKELGERRLPLFDEAEKPAVVDVENRAEHRAGGEREDAERCEVGDELRRRDGAHRARANALPDLLAERVEHVRVQGFLADVAHGIDELRGAV